MKYLNNNSKNKRGKPFLPENEGSGQFVSTNNDKQSCKWLRTLKCVNVNNALEQSSNSIRAKWDLFKIKGGTSCEICTITIYNVFVYVCMCCDFTGNFTIVP